MISIVLMFRRLAAALKYAAREEGFRAAFGAGLLLLVVGTLTYSTTQGWNVLDAFYFSVCTLTTSGVADPDLTLSDGPIKIFTVLYIVVGIGILLEIVRLIGFGYVESREARSGRDDARQPARRRL